MAIEEVRHLRKFGHEARLVVIMEEDARGYNYQDLIEDIPVVFLSRSFPTLLRCSFKFPFFSFFSTFHVTSPFFAPKVLKKSFDVIVSHETYTCFTALRILKEKGIPYVAYIHDPISYIISKVYRKRFLKHAFPLLLPAGKHLDELIVKNSIVTITNSKSTLEKVRKIVKSKKIEVAYPGCFTSDCTPEKRGNYILAFTKWDIGKNPNMFLDILEKLNKDVKLVVGGFWVQKEIKRKFISEINKKRLTNQVKIVEASNEKTIRELYLNARVLVHPIVEAFGMIGLEAAAHGCPFIIPKGSGVTELFTHGAHGFFPEEGNVDEYVKYVDALISDERLAWKMGFEARKIAEQYNWEEHTKKIERIILRNI